MSYCRFSCDDWKSDIYCYADVGGGITIHVAANRVIGDIPKAAHFWEKGDIEGYFKAHKEQMKFLETAERKNIGLPYDGEYFNENGPKEALEVLNMLRMAGYNVPQHAIDSLEEDLMFD